jgi:hypothetical protein
MAGRRQSTTQSQSTSEGSSQTSSQTVERRRRLALRALVEEMLTEIRSAASDDSWTPEERQRAEADLARIMDQVRREAFRNSPAE